jgi:hypothetical protein
MVIYQQEQNKWFTPASLQRVFFHVTQLCNERTGFFRMIRCKYLTVRIDTRTGACLLLDGHGTVLTNDEIERLFINLKIKPVEQLNIPNKE